MYSAYVIVKKERDGTETYYRGSTKAWSYSDAFAKTLAGAQMYRGLESAKRSIKTILARCAGEDLHVAKIDMVITCYF